MSQAQPRARRDSPGLSDSSDAVPPTAGTLAPLPPPVSHLHVSAGAGGEGGPLRLSQHVLHVEAFAAAPAVITGHSCSPDVISVTAPILLQKVMLLGNPGVGVGSAGRLPCLPLACPPAPRGDSQGRVSESHGAQGQGLGT